MASEDIVVLKVILNEMDQGEDFVVLTTEGDAWVSRELLKKTNLREGIGDSVEYSGDVYLSLRSVPDIDFLINE
ncbi:MAG: hypothetical protein V3T30_04410, partial [Thermodesulfobacteriota bacterium]